jgi:hypothetical protein
MEERAVALFLVVRGYFKYREECELGILRCELIWLKLTAC